MQCPSDEELRALREGELDGTSRASIEAHMAGCASCTENAAKTARSPADGVQPGTYVGRYLVVDLIGTGGMGSVYRAYDPKLNRNVAVKLVNVASSAAGEEPSRPRLLREAQALAQMVHPHVVSVFDVGEFREQVFFAMELIEGSTLRAVLRRGEHDRRELLRLLDEAGRGLAAAHGAGLVHRDFKPENVLIDGEQRAKVVDFGLARAVDANHAETIATDARTDPHGSREESASLLDRRITETGARVGTPAYMAPEQCLELSTDARTDQFTFSIVAYEALFGRHPFYDKEGRLSMTALCAGKIQVPGRRLPPGYLRVLTRGLSPDPANRYPSLQHLLDELALVPRRRRRRGIAMAAVACAAAGLIGVPVIQKHRAQRCDLAAAQALSGIWDPPRRAKVEDIFTGDGKAFGREVWNRVATALDTYSEGWKHAKVDLCRSSEWWRAPESAMHERASSCLDERRRELRAATDVLAGGDRDVRLRAPDILIQLDALSTCTNPTELALTPLPSYDKAKLTTVEPIRDLLAQSRALDDARKLVPAEDAARRALELARTQHDQALAAEALYRLSLVQRSADKYDASEASLVQALADAEASGHERLMPLIWTQLIRIVGFEKDRPGEIERLIPLTEAAINRFDPQGPARFELLFTLGLLEDKRGRYDRAIANYNAALDVARRAFSDHDVRRIRIYHQLGNLERAINQLDKGVDHALLALAETETLFGNDHPQVMKELSLLARMLSEQGDAAGARSMGLRALRIVEESSSPESEDVGHALYNLGMAYLEDGQPADALPLFRRSYTTRTSPTNAPVRLAAVARAEEALGHLETARTTFEEALALSRRAVGPGHPQTLLVGVRLGRLLRGLHRERDALQLCTQLLDAGEHAHGPHGVFIALALSCLGEGYERLGQLPEALTALERADKLLQEETTPPRQEYRALIRFALARVLWQTGGDRERARRLANDAADSYQHAGRMNAQNVMAVQSWLTKTAAQER